MPYHSCQFLRHSIAKNFSNGIESNCCSGGSAVTSLLLELLLVQLGTDGVFCGRRKLLPAANSRSFNVVTSFPDTSCPRSNANCKNFIRLRFSRGDRSVVPKMPLLVAGTCSILIAAAAAAAVAALVVEVPKKIDSIALNSRYLKQRK